MSFCVGLLPYLELDFAGLKRLQHQNSAKSVALVLESWPDYKVLRCPDWSRETAPASRHSTEYVGPAGIGSDAPGRRIGEPGIGIWGHDREATFADVKDGTSQTALLVETTRDTGPWYQGGPATIRGLRTDETPYTGAGCQFAGTHFTEKWLFFGGKPYGMNVALADGSARFMKHSVDPAILEALFTIAGGESVSNDW